MDFAFFSCLELQEVRELLRRTGTIGVIQNGCCDTCVGLGEKTKSRGRPIDQMALIQNEKVGDGGIGWIPCGGIDLILPYHLLQTSRIQMTHSTEPQA